ncbi:hypothetical protein DERF_005953 [Dermatophagoides farinae]|uniref:Ig-like domain-containing protein n=1 Tax=Dermatophagoides farinae TaxID=6954 RepID=A0A922I9C3_DERFA|nr:hypothetical protein DERF_005953 [Dermatophagoides farinae]
MVIGFCATTTTTTTTGTTFHNNNKRNNRNRKVFVKNRIKLRCIIDSNPEPYRIRWLLNHRDITLLFVSNEYQLLDKNRTLLIDGGGGGGGGGSLGRKHEGKYQCSAYNKLGRGDSSELIISVLRISKEKNDKIPVLMNERNVPTSASLKQLKQNLYFQVDLSHWKQWIKVPQNIVFVFFWVTFNSNPFC